MDKNRATFWIVLVLGILSISKFLGMVILSYPYQLSTYLYIIGNLLFMANFYLVIPSIILAIYLFVTKFPTNISIIPLFYALFPTIDWIISLISLKVLGVPVYNSIIAENSLFQLISNNYFITIIYLLISVYAGFTLRQIRQ